MTSSSFQAGPILEIEKATVYRGDTRVFEDDLSFTLEGGEHTAILGPNGSGKSTLLKLLADDVHPVPNDATRIRLFGEEQWNVWDVRKRLGMVSHVDRKMYRESLKDHRNYERSPADRTVGARSAGSELAPVEDDER